MTVVNTVQDKACGVRASNNKDVSSKRCSIHRVKSHNTRDCALRKNTDNSNMSNSRPKESLNRVGKNLIIKESRRPAMTGFKIDGNIENKECVLTVDSSATKNFIHSDMLNKYDLTSTETKSII